MHLRLRANRLLTGAALAALIAFVPSCGKKQSGGGDPAVTPPAASTDHFVFAQVNGKQVRNSRFVWCMFTVLQRHCSFRSDFF